MYAGSGPKESNNATQRGRVEEGLEAPENSKTTTIEARLDTAIVRLHAR
jgi:hypothetical protein